MRAVYQRSPRLRRPLVIAAFRGWNDAGEAASTALSFLETSLQAQPYASIDPDGFFDFQVTRPVMRRADAGIREVVWPETLFKTAFLEQADRDVVLLSGFEPAFRWRTFCDEVVAVLQHAGIELAVTLGALGTDVPHTRPVQVVGSASEVQLGERLGLTPSSYEGPTGIVGVLHDALRLQATIPSISLWASVPHYTAQRPSPKSALALVRRLETLLSVRLHGTTLDRAAAADESELTELARADDQLRGYVGMLERAFDARHAQATTDGQRSADDQRLERVSGDDIAAEVEQFLRQLHEE